MAPSKGPRLRKELQHKLKGVLSHQGWRVGPTIPQKNSWVPLQNAGAGLQPGGEGRCLARLVTRTKEFSVRASQRGVIVPPEANQMIKPLEKFLLEPIATVSRAHRSRARAPEFERVMLRPEKRRAMLEQAEARGNFRGRPSRY